MMSPFGEVRGSSKYRGRRRSEEAFLLNADMAARAKKGAEKGTESERSGRQVGQGLKPASLLCRSYGTTEVVPCYKASTFRDYETYRKTLAPGLNGRFQDKRL